eukprot:scaffold1421_cov293-Prasinococcus_capsulatus_cf.AAC.11
MSLEVRPADATWSCSISILRRPPRLQPARGAAQDGAARRGSTRVRRAEIAGMASASTSSKQLAGIVATYRRAGEESERGLALNCRRHRLLSGSTRRIRQRAGRACSEPHSPCVAAAARGCRKPAAAGFRAVRWRPGPYAAPRTGHAPAARSLRRRRHDRRFARTLMPRRARARARGGAGDG